MNSTARYATFVVLAHAGVVFWHLALVAKITPGLTEHQVLGATTAINLVPTVHWCCCGPTSSASADFFFFFP